jgi:restriction system protein
VAEPAPDWADYDPGRPGFLSRATGFTGGHERRLDEARASYEADCGAHREREALRELDLAECRRLYDKGVAEVRAAAAERNAEVERMRAGFAAGEPTAIGWYAREALGRSVYPAWYQGACDRYLVDCRQDERDLVVEVELPPSTAIPPVRRYDYDEVQEARTEVPRSQAEIAAQYAGLVASVALRTASEALAATAERADAVRAVTVHGRGSGVDPATGPAARPNLVIVSVTREILDGLLLDRVQPLACLAALGGRISLDPLAGSAVTAIEGFPGS